MSSTNNDNSQVFFERRSNSLQVQVPFDDAKHVINYNLLEPGEKEGDKTEDEGEYNYM